MEMNMLRKLSRPFKYQFSFNSARLYQQFPLQANLPKNAPPAVGYNFVMNRAANIAMNLTEKQATKTLHIFPEGSFTNYLSDNSNLYLTGYSDRPLQFREFTGLKKYSEMDYEESFKGLRKLPYRSGSFQLLVHCLPLFQPSPFDSRLPDSLPPYCTLYSPPALPFLELMSVLTCKGYAILGMPDALFRRTDMMNLLMKHTQAELVDFLSLQKIDLAVKDLELLPAHVQGDYEGVECEVVQMPAQGSSSENREGEEKGERGEGKEQVGVKYCIAVVRKMA